MKKLLAAGAVAALVMLGGGAAPATAAGHVCPAGDSGKIDVSGNDSSITLTAPEGQLITSYCVKAGPTIEIVVLEEPASSVVISHTSGKGVSHYSVWYGEGGYVS